MIIQFNEQFALPLDEIFSYFRTPSDWVRLYGKAGEVKDLGDGWFAIPLKSFPFPLVAKNTLVEPGKRVCWIFRGFWRGEGDITCEKSNDHVTLQGYEKISIRWLFFLSPIIEKRFLEHRMRRIWEMGWRRLRKAALTGNTSES